MTKKTVKLAVLQQIINHYPVVKAYDIEHAHPEHGMSGTRRLRELGPKGDGVIDYLYNHKDKTYHFVTPLGEIRKAMLNPKLTGEYKNCNASRI